jgi:hypothetical protein
MIEHDLSETKAENLDEISSRIGALIELELKKIDTLRQLQRTIDLARLVPAVMKAKHYTHVVEGGHSFTPWRTAVLVVHNEAGETQEFRLVKDNVPETLWPEHILAAYKRHLKSATRNRRR